MSSQIDQLLNLKTWAIVGLSNNKERAAFGVAEVLIEKGHTIIPVHPKAETVHGQTGYAKLSDIPVPVDVVDVFINSDLAGDIVDEAIEIGAKGVWLQLDVIDAAAIARAQEAGILAAFNHCPALGCKKSILFIIFFSPV